MATYFSRRALVALGLAALSTATLSQVRTSAPAYPIRPVKLIVAAAAGSSPDAIARQLAIKLGAMWSQPVVIENVVGLGGIVGTERAAKAPSDGYTLVLSTIGAMAVSGSLMEKLPYDPVKDFAPTSMAMSMPNLLVVHPSVPVSDVRGLIAYIKQNPGKLRYGHPGVGTSNHLSAEMFKQMAGVKMEGVPYKSSAQMMTDLLAGHYEVLFHNSSVVLPHARAGAAKILAITSVERSRMLPEVPTVAEAAGLPGFSVNAWWGIYAPAGTPPDIVTKISGDVAAAVTQSDLKTWIDNQGGVPGGGTPQALAAFQASETQKWRELIRAANIKAE
ncbi:MAG TPA: tripartite tricarboxylate transporter substrate binding protein [Ramlibacter sp.]|nr:tripartite tricarboxylate transporter substrate binding protein [Ramlibacter sp.]